MHATTTRANAIGFRTVETCGTWMLTQTEKPAFFHRNQNQRWTEKFQVNVFSHRLGMLNRAPQLRGMSLCCQTDSRSPNRVQAGIQDGFNHKGLISEQGRKEWAFFILQDACKESIIGQVESNASWDVYKSHPVS
jgi:hypothetical protein